MAVFEHLLKQVQRLGTDYAIGEYCDEFQEWLKQLFRLCQRQRMTERALHVGRLIGDYYEEGLFKPADYAEVIADMSVLQHYELSEKLERERAEAERRYNRDFHEVKGRVHPDTERCLIQAELMSTSNMRKIDASAAPLCWALAIESEFHHKVFATNGGKLARLLGIKRSSGPGMTASFREIITMLQKDAIDRTLIEKEVPTWCNVLAVPAIVENLRLVQNHRNQIAHIKNVGPYSTSRCEEFIEQIRDSGWICKLLSSLQS